VIVESVGGAGGMIGAAQVARAAPDGYQFVLGNTGTHAQNQTLYKNPLYNAATDFRARGADASTPQVLVSRKDLPATISRNSSAMRRPTRRRCNTARPERAPQGHLTCALLNAAIRIDVTHVPYRGAAPALQDLIAGRIDYLCTIASSVIAQIESKTVKPIAILSPRPLADLSGARIRA